MTELMKDNVLDLTELDTLIEDYCKKNNLDVKDAIDFLMEVREENMDEDDETNENE